MRPSRVRTSKLSAPIAPPSEPATEVILKNWLWRVPYSALPPEVPDVSTRGFPARHKRSLASNLTGAKTPALCLFLAQRVILGSPPSDQPTPITPLPERLL